MASVDGEYVGPLEAEDCARIVDDVKAGREVLPDKQLKRRKIRGGALEGRVVELLFKDIDDPALRHARRLRRGAAATRCCARRCRWSRRTCCSEMLDSAVRGRGGAGFAMGKKMSFIPRGTMDKYLVCNADESEPGAFKDRELMQKNPHQLIEGIIIGAYAIGANKSFIFIRGEYMVHQPTCSTPRWPRRAPPATSASASSAPTTRSTSWCTAAPAPTSAARRPRCSTRSRASAATRG